MILRTLKSIINTAPELEKVPPPFSGTGTIFISDIVNLKIPNGGNDLATLATNTNIAFTGTRRLIEEAGGSIISSSGDSVLAVWPPSFVSPSHAGLALTCSRNVLRQMQKMQGKDKFPYSLRIILATGKITGRSIGGRFQVVGAPLAVAKRLETAQIPKRSQILCTSETLALIPNGASSEPVGRVKGASGHEVDVFEFS